MTRCTRTASTSMPGASRRCKRPSRSEASPSECGRPRLDDAKWTRVKRGETDIHPGTTLACVMSAQNGSAGKGIRTLELLRDWTLNPAPLTWLGNPRVHICRCRGNYTCSPAASLPRCHRTRARLPFRGGGGGPHTRERSVGRLVRIPSNSGDERRFRALLVGLRSIVHHLLGKRS